MSGDGSSSGTNVEGAALQTVDLDAVRTNYKIHTTYWDAKTQLGEGFNYASPNFKIMAFVDDGESSLSRNGDPASNLGMASDGIGLDIKNPTGVSVSINSADATTTSRDVTLTLAQSDDSCPSAICQY